MERTVQVNTIIDIWEQIYRSLNILPLSPVYFPCLFYSCLRDYTKGGEKNLNGC